MKPLSARPRKRIIDETDIIWHSHGADNEALLTYSIQISGSQDNLYEIADAFEAFIPA